MCALETGAKRPLSTRFLALLHESELVRAGGWNGHYGIQTNAVVCVSNSQFSS